MACNYILLSPWLQRKKDYRRNLFLIDHSSRLHLVKLILQKGILFLLFFWVLRPVIKIRQLVVFLIYQWCKHLARLGYYLRFWVCLLFMSIFFALFDHLSCTSVLANSCACPVLKLQCQCPEMSLRFHTISQYCPRYFGAN